MTTVTEALESVLLLIEGDFRHKFAPRLKDGRLCTIVLENYIDAAETLKALLKEAGEALLPLTTGVDHFLEKDGSAGLCIQRYPFEVPDFRVRHLKQAAAIADKIKEQLG